MQSLATPRRRDFLIWTGAASAILVLDGCSAGSTSAIITTLDLVSAGIQATLPVLSVVLPPPYGTVAALIGPFLNLITGAVNKTAAELQTKDPALTQASTIESYWAQVVLTPTVLDQLPNTPISATNPQTPRTIVTALVNSANAFLMAIAANLPGVTTTPTAASAILSIKSSGATAAALSSSKPFPISHGILGIGGDMGKLKKIEKETGTVLQTIKPHYAILREFAPGAIFYHG